MKPDPKYKKIDVPRLQQEVKEMNGKSTRKLRECIRELYAILTEEPPNESPQPAPISPPRSE